MFEDVAHEFGHVFDRGLSPDRIRLVRVGPRSKS
jgi:hypothetical protein